MSRPNGLTSIAVCVVVVILGPVVVARGEDRRVPGDYPTIQAAIEAAQDGDQVILAVGTYSGEGNVNVDLQGKALIIRSTDPADSAVVAATIIDCQGSPGESRRFLQLNCGVAEPVSGLDGLTIRGASSAEGAVVIDYYSYATIRRCVIAGNTGSGIYAQPYSMPTIANCRIEENTGALSGGGICLTAECSAIIEGCLIRGNSAEAGGGIFSSNSWPEISNSEISGNYTSGQGGGVCTEDSGLLLLNCTLAANEAQRGGGLYGLSNVYMDAVEVRNSVIASNVAGTGPQVALETAVVQPADDTLIVAYSAIEGGQPSIVVPPGWVLDWAEGNLAAGVGPLFVDAAGRNYQLRAGSPCINAGDPALDYTGQTDAAGQARLFGRAVDIGAYEAVVIGLVGDINGDGRVNVYDLHRLARSWNKIQGQEGYDPAADLNGDGKVDILDLHILAPNFNKTA